MSTVREEHVVIFHSPGTFFDETSLRKIHAWDPAAAAELATTITERYNAKPFAFDFRTRLVTDPIDDGRGGVMQVEPKEISKSTLYFLGGEIREYDEIPDDVDNSTLRSNMRGNDWPIVLINTNSWKTVRPFQETNVVVDANGVVVRRGDEPALVEKRRQYLERWKAEG